MTDQAKIIERIHTLGIPALTTVQKLNELPGSYINLECRLPNRETGKILDDAKTYYGTQVEQSGIERCYGIAADETQIAVYEYGCGGRNAELIVWVKLQ